MPTTHVPFRYLSVCSGIEAATVAWHPLGWQPVAFSEIDAFPAAVLAHRYPTVPNRGDLHDYARWPAESYDCLVGGTPCQGFSVAGQRRGLADVRSHLLWRFLSLLGCDRPRWVVWENVPGALSTNDGRDFGAFLGALAELGYGWAYRVLDAQYFGLAQRRARVFVVGHLGDWRRAAAVLFERESLSGHPAPRREAGQVAPTVPRRRAAGGGLGTDFDCDGGLIAADVAPTLNAHFGTKQGLENQHIDGGAGLFVAHSLRADGFDASEDGTGRGTPLTVAHAFDARQSDVIQYGDQSGPLDTDGHSIAVAFDLAQVTSPTHRRQPSDIAGALSSTGRESLASSMAVRRLTPRECERLQGFPDDYTLISYRGKPAADGPRYKALGNSMAVPVMRWIGEQIRRVDQIGSC